MLETLLFSSIGLPPALCFLQARASASDMAAANAVSRTAANERSALIACAKSSFVLQAVSAKLDSPALGGRRRPCESFAFRSTHCL